MKEDSFEEEEKNMKDSARSNGKTKDSYACQYRRKREISGGCDGCQW